MTRIRLALLGFAAVALTACSNPTGQLIFEGLRDRVRNGPAAPPSPPPALAIDRAAIEATGVAAIVASTPDTMAQGVGGAIIDRAGIITYNFQDNRQVGLRGGLISFTRGWGDNLQMVIPSDDDPLVRPRPVADWPSETRRIYQFSGLGARFENVTAICRVSNAGPQPLDLFGKAHDVVAMGETCETDSGETFTNVYLTDPRTGFVWQSVQWTGPVQGPMQLGIIEPFDG